MDHATPNWELQIEDWDDGEAGSPMDPDIDFEETLIPAASEIKAQSTPATQAASSFAPSTSVPSTDLDEIAEGLLEGTKSKTKELDTSFLDDLL